MKPHTCPSSSKKRIRGGLISVLQDWRVVIFLGYDAAVLVCGCFALLILRIMSLTFWRSRVRTINLRFSVRDRSRQPLKAIRAPFFATHTVVDEEETRRIIFRFHRPQSWIVLTPERSLPGLVEEIAFRYIRPCVRHHLPQFIHRLVDITSILASCPQIGLMAGNTGIRRRTPASDYSEGKGSQYRRIRRRVCGGRQSFNRSPGQTLIKMQSYIPVSAAREEGVDELFLLVFFQQRGREPSGLIAVNEDADFGLVTCPPHVAFSSTRSSVRNDRVGRVLSSVLRIPPVSSGHNPDSRFRCEF